MQDIYTVDRVHMRMLHTMRFKGRSQAKSEQYLTNLF